MENILIEELNNALLLITGTAGSVMARKFLLVKLMGLTATGWGGLTITAGAISTAAIMGYKVYMGYKKEEKLKAEEEAKIKRLAELLEELNEEIIDKEENLKKYRAAANSNNHQLALYYAGLAVDLANKLDGLYTDMDELNIANPIKPPAIKNKYFICADEGGICNKAGKIKSDKVWGDINDCCVEAPMEDVMNKLSSIEQEVITLQDSAFGGIDRLKEEAFGEIDRLKYLIESERSGGSLIRKIKNKKKRKITKRKITKRKITKRNKTKRKINKRKINK